MQDDVRQAKRIVIKLGTQILIRDDGTLAKGRLSSLVHQMVSLLSKEKELLIVSSGAVGLGRQLLGLRQEKLTLSEKQACAAVGQNLLMNLYREMFDQYDKVTAQLLLTALDFSERQRYLHLRGTLEKLLELKTIPVINENDTVSISELEEDKARSFGDNDKLSALVASKLGADLLIILTNVDGIYTDNPASNPDAERFTVIEGFEQFADIITQGKSLYGRGGMASKIEAARIAAISGVHTLVTSGLCEDALLRCFQEQETVGTLILSRYTLPERKRWLGLASGYNGVVVVNDGARRALVERHASLLPSGIVDVQGDFHARQVVSIQDESGTELGRGVIHFSAPETRKIQGRQSQEIPQLLGNVTEDVVIHRNNLVIYQEYLT
jgi:glutamate 5-kinase